MSADTKDVAICVVSDGKGNFLSVSRNGDPKDLGFPGGHLEEGEEDHAAARRELEEETGLRGFLFSPVFSARRPDAVGNLSVFRVELYPNPGELRAEPGETVRWASPSEFLSPSCSFADFARANFSSLFAASDAVRMDLSPSDVSTPAFAQPVPPKRRDIDPVPRWPLTQNVRMISAAKRKALPEGKFALPASRKYPIDTAARVRNAAARLEQEKSSMPSADYSKARSAIARAAKKFGIRSDYNEPTETTASAAPPPATHAHVTAVIPPGGHVHIRHMSDEGGGEFIDTLTLADAPENGPVWNQVACVGAFKGHPAGPFELSDSVFAEIVSNWERGGRKPIPVDYEHASEADATAGNIPIHGAPAQGWITDLSNRGEAGLFGKIEWLPQARAQIRAGQYKFFSPAIRFGARDKVTGRPIGARLTSGALTNQPFLDNLSPVHARPKKSSMMASRDGALVALNDENLGGNPVQIEDGLTPEQTIAMAGYGGSFVTSSAEYMPKIKACMGLHPLATGDEMKDHLDRLRSHLAAAGGNVNATTSGVSLASYIHPLREMTFGASAHATTAEQIFDAVEHMIDAAMLEHMVEEHPQLTDTDTTAAMAGYTEPPAALADDAGDTDMATMADKDAEITRLTLQLADRDSELKKAREEHAVLLADKTARDEKDLVDDVEYVMSAHADKIANLPGDDDAKRLILMKCRKESPDFFSASYPKGADPSKAYLLRTVTPPAPPAGSEAASATGIPELDPVFANSETIGDTASRLMSEQKISFIAASEQALKLHQLARQIAV